MKEGKIKGFLNKDNTVGLIFTLPFIIGFLAFTLIPVITSLCYSFTDYRLGRELSFIGISNYKNLFGDERFLNSMKVTFIFVVISVPLKLAFALLVAYLLTLKHRGVTIYRSLYYVPSLVGGSVAVAIVWQNIFSRRGLANSIIMSLGFDRISWLGNPKLAMMILVLIAIWQFGSSMIIFGAGLKEIPVVYYEAARIDGAGRIQRFVHVTLPMLSPIILYNLVMQTISGFMTFTQAFIITGGGPNDSTNFYALYVYNHAFKWSNMGYASAMSWLMLILIAVVTVILFRTSRLWVFSADEGV